NRFDLTGETSRCPFRSGSAVGILALEWTCSHSDCDGGFRPLKPTIFQREVTGERELPFRPCRTSPEERTTLYEPRRDNPRHHADNDERALADSDRRNLGSGKALSWSLRRYGSRL